jgi:hypothetical protein
MYTGASAAHANREPSEREQLRNLSTPAARSDSSGYPSARPTRASRPPPRDAGTVGEPLRSSLYERAQKRGANYLTPDGKYLLNADGVATTNVEVLAQFDALVEAVRTNQAGAAQAARVAIEDQLYVIYVQCVLRYALLIDLDNKATPALPYAEHQGEGWAFWKVIEPIVAALDSTGAASIESMFAVTGSRPAGVRNYCTARDVLHASRPAGVSTAEYGMLETYPPGHCGEIVPSNPGSTSGGGSGGGGGGNNDDDDDGGPAVDEELSPQVLDDSISTGTIAGIVIGLLAAAGLVGATLFFYNSRLKNAVRGKFRPSTKITKPKLKANGQRAGHNGDVLDVTILGYGEAPGPGPGGPGLDREAGIHKV